MNGRRRLLYTLGLGWSSSQSLWAQHTPTDELLSPHVGNQPVYRGRVLLEMPRLADNGFSVPLKVSVSSPMTTQDHVRKLLLLSNRNHRPLIAEFDFGPGSGEIRLATRVRLGGSQTVTALALTSEGRWWLDSADVEVTESACLDQT